MLICSDLYIGLSRESEADQAQMWLTNRTPADTSRIQSEPSHGTFIASRILFAWVSGSAATRNEYSLGDMEHVQALWCSCDTCPLLPTWGKQTYMWQSWVVSSCVQRGFSQSLISTAFRSSRSFQKCLQTEMFEKV